MQRSDEIQISTLKIKRYILNTLGIALKRLTFEAQILMSYPKLYKRIRNIGGD